MPVALADSEVVSLSDRADSELSLDLIPSLAGIEGRSDQLDGRAASGGDEEYGWLEPAPGIEPVAFTRVALQITVDRGGSNLPAPAQVFSLPEGDLLRVVYYTLTLAIGITHEETIIRWWLEQGGDDATLRTDALDFLAAYHRQGLLTVTDLNSGLEVGRARLRQEQSFDPELAEKLEFLRQVAVLEEWSGHRIPLPAEVSAEQATAVSRAVAMVHARQVPLVIGRELTVTVSAEAPLDFDELRLPRDIREPILGVEVPLGRTLIPIRVHIEETERLDDRVRVRCKLADDQPEHVVTHLYPPPSRSRLLRRTLVAGAPLPPRPGELSQRLEMRRLGEAERYLAEREAETGPIPSELLAEVERQWPE